jgi:geranylgeranyl pyrophosphate synthase
MEERFQEYCRKLGPILDAAIEQTLRRLFQGVHARPGAALKNAFQGGKRLRGSLVCLINDSLGGSPESALPRAVAVELIHGATLIHDDFVDQDRIRRNKPAAWTLEGARKAVLLGDVIFASAIEAMSDLGREDGLAVSRAIARLAKGAFQEPLDPLELAGHIEAGTLPAQLYDSIIELKTGVLFGVACGLGARAAGADAAIGEACYRYGRLIGEAYQIADDLTEIRFHLSGGMIDAREMAALAPALLCFGEDAQAWIGPVLTQEPTPVQGVLSKRFEEVRLSMERAMAERLESARQEASLFLSGTRLRETVYRAPWEIVEMFNTFEGRPVRDYAISPARV